jgi:TonB family protein
LSESLLRLELSSLELKQYLDKIDDRMRRLEQLGDLSSLSPASREDVRPQTEAPSSRTDADLVHKSDVNGNGSSRLVLAPDVLPDTGRISEEREDSSEEAQTEDDAQIGWDWNIIGLGILVLMVAGAFAWQRYSTLLEGKFSSLMQEMHVVKATPNAESSIDKGTVSEGAAAVPASGGSSSSAPQQGVRAIYGGSQVAGSGTDFREREKMATDLPAATTAGTTAADDGSGAAGLVNVAPDLMESHLILSRVPTYPEAAKEAQVEGAVEAEVIISKSGTVKRVHVIDGDPLLRGAAAEAIQKYRYQPYLINGRPFEVATTVTVNFIMNQ